MRHKFGYKKLNRTSEHRKAMIKNMLNSLIKYEQITTTLPKAKVLKPQADKIITLGKKQNFFHINECQIGCINPPLPESESSSSFSVSTPSKANIPNTIEDRTKVKGNIELCKPISIYSPMKIEKFL